MHRATDPIQTATAATGSGSFRVPRLSHARVKDAMHPGLITIAPETPLREAARILSTRHIHCLVVTRAAEQGTPPRWALLSAFDLVRAANDRDIGLLEDRTAEDIAVSDSPTVSSDDPLPQAAQLMAARGTEHLIVLGAEDGRPVGVLSTLDVAGIMAWGEV
jgi:CBS domain-containing protein